MQNDMIYDRLYQQIHGHLPPPAMTHGESDADLLGEGRGFMDGFDHTIQLQVGCPAGCQFCYVSTGARLAPRDVQRKWGFEVRTKRNVATKLRRHLVNGDLADRTLYWSGVTDPYAAPPWLTRQVWQVLCEAPAGLKPRRIAVQTRFRPDRDAAFIARYIESAKPSDGGPPVVVSYSVGTDRNDLIRAWERATPCFESRLRAIEALLQSGVFVVATLSPFGAWRDLHGALERFRALGVAYITVLFFKDRTGATTTPRPFLEHLRREHPELLDPAWQAERVREMEEVYGSERVLVGKPGFSSLACPHTVAQFGRPHAAHRSESDGCA